MTQPLEVEAAEDRPAIPRGQAPRKLAKALTRALTEHPEDLLAIVRALIEKAQAGNTEAIKIVLDRVDGPLQFLGAAGDFTARDHTVILQVGPDGIPTKGYTLAPALPQGLDDPTQDKDAEQVWQELEQQGAPILDALTPLQADPTPSGPRPPRELPHPPGYGLGADDHEHPAPDPPQPAPHAPASPQPAASPAPPQPSPLAPPPPPGTEANPDSADRASLGVHHPTASDVHLPIERAHNTGRVRWQGNEGARLSKGELEQQARARAAVRAAATPRGRGPGFRPGDANPARAPRPARSDPAS